MKNVLLIDDEKDLITLIAEDFEDVGYKVKTVFDGPSALKAIKKQKYDLIITDNHMPGFTGLELVRYLKEKDYNIPVYIFSGNTSIEGAVIDAGARGLITKPCTAQEILRRVEA